MRVAMLVSIGWAQWRLVIEPLFIVEKECQHFLYCGITEQFGIFRGGYFPWQKASPPPLLGCITWLNLGTLCRSKMCVRF